MPWVFDCDLHMHTYYSDGRASPDEVLHHAAGIGLKTVAIADHDNARGAREARPIAAKLGLELIPAIELTCRWDVLVLSGRGARAGDDLDLLGYFVDLDDPDFQRLERDALDDIRVRMTDCCASLTAAGYPLALNDVLEENPRYPGAVQFAATLRRKGYAEGWGASLGLFESCWMEMRPSPLTLDRAIDAVHAAGGVAVLAHPATIVYDGGWLGTDQITDLVGIGLDGLEVYHWRLDAEARDHFLGLAKVFNLLVTGGSDEHGWRPGFPRMGTQPVTPEMVEALRGRSLGR